MLALAASLLLLSSASLAVGPTSMSLSLTAYSDGYVHVAQTFTVDPKATSVQLPVLSASVSDLVATDQNGSPLSYGFGAPGDNITVYTLGASSVTLRYDTSDLTSKNGTVWTLSFGSSSNSTVVLPPSSTLVSTSGTPYSIVETGGSPTLSLSPGSWGVSYGVPFSEVSSTSSGTATTGPAGTGGGDQLELGVGIAVLAAAVVVAFLFWRRRRLVPVKGDLRPDDVQVLNFIKEKGGKVLEPEIRTRFALPKTTAWRQIKRLERMGYVKVTKIGSQNQIEIAKVGGSEP
jgi:MYXO-CTERM domain-containing protein